MITLREAVEDAIDTARADHRGDDPVLVPADKLQRVLQHHPDVDSDRVVVSVEAQALVLWCEGRAVVVSDSAPVPEYLHPIERAVMVARLRAVADALEVQGAPA